MNNLDYLHYYIRRYFDVLSSFDATVFGEVSGIGKGNVEVVNNCCIIKGYSIKVNTFEKLKFRLQDLIDAKKIRLGLDEKGNVNLF